MQASNYNLGVRQTLFSLAFHRPHISSSLRSVKARLKSRHGVSLVHRCQAGNRLAPIAAVGTSALPRRSCICASTGDSANISASLTSPELPPEAEALQVPSGVELPEELTPLVEALEQAQQRVLQVSALRDALETKAQEVAQLAINAREAVTVPQRMLDEAAKELQAVAIVQEKLQAEIAAGQAQLQPALAADGDGGALDTVDLRETAAESSGDQQHVEGAAEEVAAFNARELADELAQKEALLATVSLKLQEHQSKVRMLEEQASLAEESAVTAEEVAAMAMRAAENAVREEMEAAAVAKETKTALAKSLADLQELGISFAEVDAATAEERARNLEQNRINAETAVDAALASSDVSGALANVDITLSMPGAAAAAAAAPPSVVKKAAPDVPKQAPPPMSRSWASSSMDEDGKPIKRKAKKGGIPQQWVALGIAAAAFAVALQLMPGGILSNTPLAIALQRNIQYVGHLIGRAMTKAAILVARLPFPQVPHGEEGLVETIWLLATSVIAVPLICKLPGGSAVLGFLAGGAMIGPHALGIIQDVEGVRHLAELGVVFLLFNIGLELSLERLRSMQKYVFGMGTSQVVTTLAAVAYTCMAVAGLAGPASVVVGGALALSSTAVAMQVLQDRNETGSRHGRATFAVLLLQDLAVVVLLMLIPLLAPHESGEGPTGFIVIAKALGVAAVKAVTCIVGIIVGGRTVLRPLYRRIADLDNAAIFSALTLLVVLGTSYVTQLCGLSLALGAFLAGLLLAETEFVMQVESDIAPYKDLLMGLFFMTVGMEISVGLFLGQFKVVMGVLALLVIGKVLLMVGVGQSFGLSRLQSARAGLLLAAGGEFAFVALGEAVSHKILQPDLVQLLFLVVALSMALTPFLAEFGQRLGKTFERGDVKTLQPNEKETEELRDHVIIAGFGRVGQIIAQLLSERLIPFVALDVRTDRVQVGKEADLPVYFGDAGSSAILHSIGAAHARCAVITLDTPGANYRTVWALHKHFPKVKIYVRAHDVTHGITLEKAGATAVVPETLEPSLQLASAVLSELNMPGDEVAQAIQAFRKNHVAELQVLCKTSGSSLGYGFRTIDDDDILEQDGAFQGGGSAALAITEAIP